MPWGIRLCLAHAVTIPNPAATVRRAVLRVNRADNEEMALLAARADMCSAGARSRSTPLAGPGAEQEFSCARHGDVQRAGVLLPVRHRAVRRFQACSNFVALTTTKHEPRPNSPQPFREL